MDEGPLSRARQAHAAGDWPGALALYMEAAGLQPLGVEDLERLAEAAMWAADFERCVSFCEEAFALRIAADESRSAGGLALHIAYLHVSRGRASVALGWFLRAQELLAGQEPCVELAQLEDVRGLVAMILQGDLDAALAHFRAAAALATQVGAPGQGAVSSVHAATVLTRTGQVSSGLREIDRVMTAAVAGELDPFSTARVYCGAISLCQALGDVRRAREWAEEVDRCSHRPGLGDFPGDCRLHRAELTRLSGAWAAAQAEIERAIPELERWDLAHVADAWYDLGELNRLRGDFDAAAAAYARAEELGKSPQPGLSLLRVALGDAPAAVAMLTAAIAGANHDPPLEAQLCAAAVEAHLACGDRSSAVEAAARVSSLGTEFGTVVVQATAAVAECLTTDSAASIAAGRRAVSLWRDAGAPFESALAQSVLADAYRRGGEPAMARIELEAAYNTFVALGAGWHAHRAQDALARSDVGEAPSPVRRTFVFTDVVNSTRLLAAMGDAAWVSVLRWHDDTIRTQLHRWHGREVKQRGGGDGFFAVFTDPAAAIQCAIAIQTEFARHRDVHGFAPEIRIGVHEADALDLMGDYTGRGVHEAARIAELARGGQILASKSTAGDAPTTGATQSVQLRGLPGTTDVVDVRW